MSTHDFNASLAYEGTRAFEMDLTYMSIFGPSAKIERVTDIGYQRRGVDKFVHTKGRAVAIDENLCRKNHGSIVIEYESDSERGTPGWTVDPKKITDLVVYSYEDTGTYITVPFNRLRACAIVHEKKWSRVHGRVEIPNTNHTTVCVFVPLDDARKDTGLPLVERRRR